MRNGAESAVRAAGEPPRPRRATSSSKYAQQRKHPAPLPGDGELDRDGSRVEKGEEKGEGEGGETLHPWKDRRR